MSIYVHLTRTAAPDGEIAVKLNDVADPFAVVTLGPVELSLHNQAECDALVRAALAARDLLPEPAIDPATLNDALADAAEAEPEAAGYCPICSGKLDVNGRHITRSGARIEAAS